MRIKYRSAAGRIYDAEIIATHADGRITVDVETQDMSGPLRMTKCTIWPGAGVWQPYSCAWPSSAWVRASDQPAQLQLL